MKHHMIQQEYEPFDSCFGTVLGSNRQNTGIYLMLDNGQKAFSFDGQNLEEGDQVICSVKRPSYEGRAPLVLIDTVWAYSDSAA